MHMLKDQQLNYGGLCDFLKNQLPGRVRDSNVWKMNVSKYGDLDVGNLLEWDTSNGTRLDLALKWGSDPMVIVTDLSRSFGRYHPGDNLVHLDRQMVDEYEEYTKNAESASRNGGENTISNSDAKVWGNNTGRYALLIEIVTTSLLVTWGDFWDGKYGGYKRIKKFQRELFGKIRKRSRLLVEIE